MVYGLRPSWRAYWRRRSILRNARFATKLAEEKARRHLSVYKVKSDIEWDLRFMGPLDKSWKDEFVLLVLAYPLLGLMVPGLREPIIQGFEYLAKIDPAAPSIFTYGWATIFLATFGRNLAKNFTLPGKFASIIQAMGSSKPDVPDEAAEAAQDAVSPSPPTAYKEPE